MKKYTEMNDSYDIAETKESYTCRICLDDEYDITKLIKPCRCDGSSKYVHIDCLKQWRLISERDGNEGSDKCMECKSKYIIRRNVEREHIIIIKTSRLLRGAYYVPIILTFALYFADQNYNFINVLDFGQEYPIKKCDIYLDPYTNKNHTSCFPITVRGYLLEGDLGFGFFLYLSFVLSFYMFFAFNFIFCKQRKWLKKPYRFYKKYGYCKILTNIIFTLNSFIIYYAWRFNAPMGVFFLTSMLIPFQGVNVNTAYKSYLETLTILNNSINDDDTILPWDENYIENNGYDMIEINNEISSDIEEDID